MKEFFKNLMLSYLCYAIIILIILFVGLPLILAIFLNDNRWLFGFSITVPILTALKATFLD